MCSGRNGFVRRTLKFNIRRIKQVPRIACRSGSRPTPSPRARAQLLRRILLQALRILVWQRPKHPRPRGRARTYLSVLRMICPIAMIALQRKRAAPSARPFNLLLSRGSALAGFEPALRLVDHIDAALTAHDAAIAMALLERAEGVTYLHGSDPSCRGARIAPWVTVTPRGKSGTSNSWWTILGSNQ